MSDCDFMLMPIKELFGQTFVIPSYQRGYRWGEQQVRDLLDDINEIDDNDPLQKYCLQPLVVASRKITKKDFQNEINRLNALGDRDDIRKGDITTTIDKLTKWEVIDGQQRLTTISIIIKFLGNNAPYTLSYDTRKDSEQYLRNAVADEKGSDDNIDYFHMHQCYVTVRNWFEGKDEKYKEGFLKKLTAKVYFIWYNDESGNPVDTFTRLNINKIALTNAELIKAMLLKQSNFAPHDATSKDDFRLTQLEMATQWDEIEFALQKDEFWYFIHPQEWVKPTRIDFIFELIKDMNCLDFSVAQNYNLFGQHAREDNNKDRFCM